MFTDPNKLCDLRGILRSLGDHASGALAQARAAKRLNLSFNIESSPRIDMSNPEHVPYILGEVLAEIKKSNPNFFERIKNAMGNNIDTFDYDLITALVDIGLIEKLPEQVQKKLESRSRLQSGIEAFLDGLTLGPVFRAATYDASSAYVQSRLDRISRDMKLASFRWNEANLKIAKEILPTI